MKTYNCCSINLIEAVVLHPIQLLYHHQNCRVFRVARYVHYAGTIRCGLVHCAFDLVPCVFCLVHCIFGLVHCVFDLIHYVFGLAHCILFGVVHCIFLCGLLHISFWSIA